MLDLSKLRMRAALILVCVLALAGPVHGGAVYPGEFELEPPPRCGPKLPRSAVRTYNLLHQYEDATHEDAAIEILLDVGGREQQQGRTVRLVHETVVSTRATSGAHKSATRYLEKKAAGLGCNIVVFLGVDRFEDSRMRPWLKLWAAYATTRPAPEAP